ncbi:MAG: integrase [Eubacterium sp.]|nr:integrase [Eubacterium sp.]MCC8173181.1 hypothetical protein [Odoribacter sp.]
MDNIAENENFSYDGYQVVRGEFFAHIKEPSITFNNCKVYVNAACLNKMPNTDFVQILINSNDKKLVIRPCIEEEKDSFCWYSRSAKRRPKQITCRIFFAKIIQLMDWNPDYRYKSIGKMVHANNENLFVFDLKTAETFRRITKTGSKPQTSRIPIFPEDWKEQFGIPFEEHKKSLQVNIVEGYAVFSLANKKENTSLEQLEIGGR